MTVVPGAQFTHFAYSPSIPANALYIVLFSGCLIAQIAQGVRYQTWQFTGVVLVGISFEILGYTSRIFMHNDPSSRGYFLLNNIFLILGPSLVAAGIYLCMGNLVRVYGQHMSALKPRTYLILFVACDMVNLSLGGVGGGISSTSQNPDEIQTGLNIVIAGLSTQVTSLFLFMLCCLHFAIMVNKHKDQRLKRFRALRDTRSFRLFLYSLGLATTCIFVRSTFRMIELREGFTGRLANNETYFMILEGVMTFTATMVMTIFHPGRCFQGYWNDLPNMTTSQTFIGGEDDDQSLTKEQDDNKTEVSHFNMPSCESFDHAAMPSQQPVCTC